MTFRQMEFFVALAKLQHMTKAAESLNTTQPNLSRAIKDLEYQLGASLFEKEGRNIRLTKYGKFLLPYAEDSMASALKGQEALKQLISPHSGHIDLGFIYTMGYSVVPPLLKAFNQISKHKQITFSSMQGSTEQLIASLLEEKVDICLCSYQQNPNIDFTPLFKQEIVLITPIDHPLAIQSEVSIHDIGNHPFIKFAKGSGLRPEINRIFETADPLNVVYELTEDHSIAGFVEAGFGIAVVPKIKTLSSFNLKVIKLIDLPFERKIYLATRKSAFLPPVLKSFKKFLIENIEDFL